MKSLWAMIAVYSKPVTSLFAGLALVVTSFWCGPVRGDNELSSQMSPEKPSSPPAWSLEFDTGATGSQGNSETFDYRSALNLVYATEAYRLKSDAAYYYGSSQEMVTRNEYTAGVLNDRFFTGSPWSLFAAGRYDWNRFESWQSRLNAHAGAAYKVVDSKDLESYLRLGGGFIKEYGSEDEKARAEGLLGAEVTWSTAPGQELYADITYHPDFSEPGEYRLLSSASFKAGGADNGIALRLGVENEYQSEVEPGFDHNNLKYYGSLVISFDFWSREQ